MIRMILSLSCALSCALASHAAEVNVYLLGGQSNMEGQGNVMQLSEAQKTFDKKVFFWNGKSFEPLVVGKTNTSNRLPRFGLELSFAKAISRDEGPIYLVKYSASGMPLHYGWNANQWIGGKPVANRTNFYPGKSVQDPHKGRLYQVMNKRFQSALTALKKQGHEPKVKAFLWMQGEQDSKQKISATTYAESLRLLFKRVQEDTGGKEMTFLYGQVLPYKKAKARFTHRTEIREQMAHADMNSGKPESIPNALMVSTDDCPLKPDTVHHNTLGYWKLGQKFATRLIIASKAKK